MITLNMIMALINIVLGSVNVGTEHWWIASGCFGMAFYCCISALIQVVMEGRNGETRL